MAKGKALERKSGCWGWSPGSPHSSDAAPSAGPAEEGCVLKMVEE